jgi:LemA protein
MNKRVFGVVLVVGLLVVTGLLTVLAYNGMVSKSQTVDKSVSDIKNRYTTKTQVLGEMLPQVRQYQQFEQSTLTNITLLRTQWMNAVNTSAPTSTLINISSQLDTNTAMLVATYENYPELHSIDLVSGYMGEIVNQNEMLSYSRGSYNGAVRDYNTFIQSFPNNLFAGSFGYSVRPYWGPELPDNSTLSL